MTLSIKVLGPGCQNCHKVGEHAVEALEALSRERPDLQATVEHVTEPEDIMAYPIVATPGLVVNEELVCAGRIPTVEEALGWMREALDGAAD